MTKRSPRSVSEEGGQDVGEVKIGDQVPLVLMAIMAGPQAALIAESFTGRLRYSGASLGAPLGGGVASALGVVLLQRFHSAVPVALYMIACCALSIIGVGLLRERRNQDLSIEYDEPRTSGQAPAAVVRP